MHFSLSQIFSPFILTSTRGKKGKVVLDNSVRSPHLPPKNKDRGGGGGDAATDQIDFAFSLASEQEKKKLASTKAGIKTDFFL